MNSPTLAPSAAKPASPWSRRRVRKGQFLDVTGLTADDDIALETGVQDIGPGVRQRPVAEALQVDEDDLRVRAVNPMEAARIDESGVAEFGRTA